MKTGKFTEEQVADALRLSESGAPVSDVCRQLGISEASCTS
ncbi:MAG: transposase [Betaproteobacteria bacterium]|nr:transposase [Betaproteobacteria bacterium]MDE1956386.1 transposase [Betaproteobacteria bacterium]MDE2153953.1 transposase [Betaproteobacteria bacterium]